MRWGAWAWIGILLVIGIVQLVRAQWFDAAVFVAISALLFVDVCRGSLDGLRRGEREVQRRVSRQRRAPVPWPWIVVVAVVVGVTASLLPRYSVAMQVLLCLAGGAAVVAVWPRRSRAIERWSPGL